jgi:nitronate monooxygenase
MPLPSRLPEAITRRLRLPLIAAPMRNVSNPALVMEACRAGIIGSFPTGNAASPEELEEWLTLLEQLSANNPEIAPWAPNLTMRRARVEVDVPILLKHRVEMVITSVGSPAPVVGPLHEIGCLVFSDVASVEHARKAADAGADGLILLTAGAGGLTGWMNPFAFVRAVRQFFDGPLVMAGGISDGQSLYAAEVLGCDLGYMGTKFIATEESMAHPRHKELIVASRAEDVVLTRQFHGADANVLRLSIEESGFELQAGGGNTGGRIELREDRPGGVWTAGHTVFAVSEIRRVSDIVDEVDREYREARLTTA